MLKAPVLSFQLSDDGARLFFVLNSDNELVYKSLSYDDAEQWWWNALSDDEQQAQLEYCHAVRIDAEMARAEHYERVCHACDR